MKNSKIKICFVLPNLRAGGAERVMSFIAQKLDTSKFETTLIIIGNESEAAYDIKGINVIYFNKPRVQSGITELYKFIKKNKPEIVFSAIGHLNTVTAYMSWFFPKIKFVAREVNVLSVLAQFNEQSNKFSVFEFIEKYRFNRFDKVICQSQDMLNDLNKSNNIKQNKLVVINNPVTSGFKTKKSNKTIKPLHFITVARLVKQKGHARLIEVLGKLNFPFHYTIIGDGPEKNTLFNRIEELGFGKNVTNIPFTDQVSKYLENSNVYLQGSFVEGFPNAIIESCMVGTPVIAFDAPGGINEIIKSDINGFVVKTEDDFIEQLNNINKSYKFNPEDVSKTISSRYTEEIIIKKYEDLFINLIK
ncbi:glycosyltransferase [uncultured Winogradskyella sp.]|uniref:glycosyltransferase n=1 Tax=uncultured Winogradskyella sp. TaxID=395353 RepID=UPI0030EB5FC7